jgi:hypothetical protein
VLTRERLQIGSSEHVALDPGDFSTREAIIIALAGEPYGEW